MNFKYILFLFIMMLILSCSKKDLMTIEEN